MQRLLNAVKELLPYIHDENMAGETAFELAVLELEQAYQEAAQQSVQSDGAYCTHCGDLLSDHFINERGEGWCEPPHAANANR